MPRGLFITLEGLDGSGKTTQIKRLAAWLKDRVAQVSLLRPGIDKAQSVASETSGSQGAPGPDSRTWDSENPVLIRQPGGTVTGDRIRALVLDSRSTGLAPMTEMALMFADRAQAIAEIIQPALDAGKIVLCDRFTDSTEAYQGGGRQLGSEPVLELHRLVCGNLQPDLTLLLLPSLESSLVRARRRNQRVQAQADPESSPQATPDENRFESEQDSFYIRVWQKYREIALREPTRVVLIEGDLAIDEVHEKIVEAVSNRLQTTSQMR
jgi:dTMP kinase